mgnify:CR=1 FL=1
MEYTIPVNVNTNYTKADVKKAVEKVFKEVKKNKTSSKNQKSGVIKPTKDKEEFFKMLERLTGCIKGKGPIDIDKILYVDPYESTIR